MKMELDPMQEKAVYTDYRNVVVCAPPGSGKTTVIINRVYNLVENRGIDPSNILVITFTKSAAENMKYRYLKISSGRNRTPFFGTFHSLFYRILSKYGNKIDIISEDGAQKLITGILRLYMDQVESQKVKYILNDISHLKSESCNMDDFKSKVDKSIFKHCFNVYEEYKKKHCLMDFDDLQFKARELFLENSYILNKCRNIFKYILIDEFQDSDRIQMELLKLIAYGNSIFAVGDEDQCIYGFRGSNPECMVNFDMYFDRGRKLFLNMNYRSVENIVELSKVLISNNKNRNDKIIKPHRKKHGNMEFMTFKSVNEESDYISFKTTGNRYNFEDTAVFYRSNMESRSIIDSFLAHGIKFRFLNEPYNFFEHYVCRDIIAYLKLSVDGYDRKSFERIANRPYRYISRINIGKVRENPIRDNCFDILKDMGGISNSQIKVVHKLKRKVEKLNKMPLQKTVDFIMYDIGYMQYLKVYCSKIDEDISKIEYIVEEFREVSKKFSSIDELLKYIDKFSNATAKSLSSNEGIVLSTIHGVKGMEFANVFMVNCNEGIIPHVNSIPGNIEEERRLFYVGITRAIDNLHLCSVETFGGKPKKVSRFINECVPYI
ncbi:MAG: ATP-dependent helicase [Clostridium sp.]|jgi:DNA helicase-2/ATP-dependent DNA helicase PcrA|uniref:ATP-dependent helicase n=1 Tax=Clostridium sp. TaxID=1506 RepID=UPI0025BA8022|nr:ATP-dependent helicase [Clostridium sp.]MCH3963940.1 ATP-dependent helicase [Clostridium sp.]MCI1716141.1 ATP-dependent helicase [Clostridium sp.]MCI1800619.1 ATP-dependent helicase [Clostridium sp.]MCI1814318.1 ATP-dependent helicase [Clostridium sp.]MCI1871217.1 ATP-dependent helicase [Clostridium sp.]